MTGKLCRRSTTVRRKPRHWLRRCVLLTTWRRYFVDCVDAGCLSDIVSIDAQLTQSVATFPSRHFEFISHQPGSRSPSCRPGPDADGDAGRICCVDRHFPLPRRLTLSVLAPALPPTLATSEPRN